MSAGLVERPLATTDAQQVIGVNDVKGVVRAIVSVTGVTDEVNDVIEPGAYRETLKARPHPKSCDGHDWAKPIGVAVSCEEWLPGDPRLPAFTKDGRPWPAAAGALVADIQFNLDTERGEQAFKDVKFYSERGVAEWSIGYQVPEGGATPRDAKGVRRIKRLDLYTVDPVLFGAAPLSMTLDIKSAAAVVARLMGDDGTEIERKGGDPHDFLEFEQKYDTSPVGKPGGRQNWVDRVGGLPAFIRAIAHALIRNGKSEQNAIQIAVGTVKRWASGGGKVSAKTRAKAAAAVAEWERDKASSHAKSLFYDPALEVGPDAGHTAVDTKAAPPEPSLLDGEPTLTYKAFPNLPGTLEERLELVRTAVTAALKPPQADTGEGASSGDRPGRAEECYVSVDGTTASAVVASVHHYDTGERRTYQMDYTVGGDGDVLIGAPEEIRLVVVPQSLSDAADDAASGDNPDLDEDLEEWLATMADWLPPFDGMVTDVADSVSKVLSMVPETKAGRVLSGANAGLLRQAVEHLIAVLKAAGIDVNPNQPPAAPDSTPETTATTVPQGAPPGVAEKSLPPLPGLPDPDEVLRRITESLA